MGIAGFEQVNKIFLQLEYSTKEDLISSLLKNTDGWYTKQNRVGIVMRGTKTSEGKNQSMCLVHQPHFAKASSLRQLK